MTIFARLLALVKRRPVEAIDPWDVERDPALWPASTDNFYFAPSEFTPELLPSGQWS